MRPLTKDTQAAGARLWESIDGAEKVASVEVATPELSCGPQPRPGFVFDYGGVKIASGQPQGETFMKLAGVWDAIRRAGTTFGESIQKALTAGRSHMVKVKDGPRRPTEALTALEKTQLALGGAAAGGAIALTGAGVSAANEQRRFSQVELALHADPWFEGMTDKSNVSEAYGLMKRYAPSIAKDPIVARSFVRVMVESPELKHTQTVQELLEAEKKFRESGAFTEDLFDLRRSMRAGSRALGLSGGK